ncbi:MAG TPA: hypothetical protein PKE19_12040 [Aestuariivirga sp.]|jgi:hypothetical protein|nr:hypothetical protein [Aestuariivirga sp.]
MTTSDKSSSHEPQERQKRLPRLSRLMILLYPFAMAAVAINLFLLGLLGQSLGLPAISPTAALIASVPLGVPACWGFARWVRHLMAEAGGL